MKEISGQHPIVGTFENITIDLEPVPIDEIKNQTESEKILVDLGDNNHWLLKKRPSLEENLNYMVPDVEVMESGGLNVTQRLAMSPPNVYNLFTLFPNGNDGAGEAAMYELGQVDAEGLAVSKETPGEEILPYVKEGYRLSGYDGGDNSPLYIPKIVAISRHDELRFRIHDTGELNKEFIDRQYGQPHAKIEGELAHYLQDGNFEVQQEIPTSWSSRGTYYYDLKLRGQFKVELQPLTKYDEFKRPYHISDNGAVEKVVGISGKATYEGDNYLDHRIVSTESVPAYDLSRDKLLELAEQDQDGERNASKIQKTYIGLADLIGKNVISPQQLVGEAVVPEEVFRDEVFNRSTPMGYSYGPSEIANLKSMVSPSKTDLAAELIARSLSDWTDVFKGNGRQVEPRKTGFDEVYQELNPRTYNGDLLL